MKTLGNHSIMAAIARTLALPVVSVIYQMSAKPTNWLPNREKACPLQMVKNLAFHPFLLI
jgi:hypothetical protein